MEEIREQKMKIILSRKGFDSKYGGMPSPILPDGTLLSLPIPSEKDCTFYEELTYNGKSYAEIIRELKPTNEVGFHCHLDPDIRKDIIDRPEGWKQTFGQGQIALLHLLNTHKVSEGDVFLFFGRFRETEVLKNGTYRFVKGSESKHIIWGYLQVGKIILNPQDLSLEDVEKEGIEGHPHLEYKDLKDKNAIFVAADRLSWDESLPGAGCLNYDKCRVLTKAGEKNYSYWSLPDFFRQIEISYNKNSWKDDYFQSASIGQEFVFSSASPPKEEERETWESVGKWVGEVLGTTPAPLYL